MPLVDLFVYIYSKKMTVVKIAFLVVLFVLAIWACWMDMTQQTPPVAEAAK